MEVIQIRKSFTTTIEETIQNDFKVKCKENNDKMNDILEAFMRAYINGDVKLEQTVRIVNKK